MGVCAGDQSPPKAPTGSSLGPLEFGSPPAPAPRLGMAAESSPSADLGPRPRALLPPWGYRLKKSRGAEGKATVSSPGLGAFNGAEPRS